MGTLNDRAFSPHLLGLRRFSDAALQCSNTSPMLRRCCAKRYVVAAAAAVAAALRSDLPLAQLVVALTQANYVRKLLDLFAQCEDLGAEAELVTLFEIFKALVLLNDTLLLEHLFAPDVSLEVFGVFEYDSAVAPHNRVPHRQVLATARAFREVVSLGNEQLRQKVHQTHRMIYLKEVVLPRVLDDNTLSSISSLVYFNQVEIVTHLRDDKRFVGELFERLRAATAADELQALVALLQEFCLLARNLQLKGRTSFYETLMRAGLYECVLKLLSSPIRAVRLAVLDVLGGALVHNPAPWRARSLAADEPLKLGDVLVERLLTDTSGGVRSQCAEALRLLLHTDGGPMVLSSSYVGFGVDLMLGAGIDNEPSFAHEEPSGATAGGSGGGGGGGTATSMDEDHLPHHHSPTSPASPTSPTPGSPESRRREQAQRMHVRSEAASNGDWIRAENGAWQRQQSQSHTQSSSPPSPKSATSAVSSSSSSSSPTPPPPPPSMMPPPSNGSDTLYSQAAAFTVYFYERGLAERLLGLLQRAAQLVDQVPSVINGGAANQPSPPEPGAVDVADKPMSDASAAAAAAAGDLTDLETADTVSSVIELFGFCVLSHSFRARSFALKHDLVGVTARLCASTTAHVALSAIRFMRLLVSMPDDFYVRRILRHDLLRWMMHAFVRNGPARNLLNSAVINLCGAVRESNNKLLIAYVVKNYATLFADIEYVDTFRLLLLKYEQSDDSQLLQRQSSNTASSQHQHAQQSLPDTLEDEYFESDAAAADGAATSDAATHERKRLRVAVDFVPRPIRSDATDDGAGNGFSSVMASRPPAKRPLTLKLKLSSNGDGTATISQSQQQQQQQQHESPHHQ